MSTKVLDVSPFDLNAEVNLFSPEGKLQLDKDKEAARQYFLQVVNPSTMFFHSLAEKLEYLIENEYYEKEFLDQYSYEFTKSLYKRAYAYKFRFPTFMGAYKYYSSYTLKTFDGKNFLERYEDRVVAVSLYLARGDEALAEKLVDEIITGRLQPATPTFLNAGKKQRGDMTSCFLLQVQDNLESINRAIASVMQLSKRGGGVALNLSDIREAGAPIKNMEGIGSGVVPFMKVLEDSFSWINQLGQRSGAGAVYLNAHHPDILEALDTKRENADEKVRIKSLSFGVVVPDITFELAKNNEPMYLFSPYDVEKEYGIPLSRIKVTEKYREMVENPRIRKKKINARDFFQTIASLSFESGYPYVIFEDNVNKANNVDGYINMSNLCVEIMQVSTDSVMNEDLSYKKVGNDISCNLASLNVAKVMEGGNLAGTIDTSIRALTSVSEFLDIAAVPTINKANSEGHAIGLGQMNLAGFFAKEKMIYGDEESIDFTNIYFYTVAYYAYKASNKLAQEKQETFHGFSKSKYADGTAFEKYVYNDWAPQTEKVRNIFEKYGIEIPSRSDWAELSLSIQFSGLYNQNLQAIAPTGSISYVNHSSASILPFIDKVETRKEGKTGRIYVPAPYLTDDNSGYYIDAYQVGPEKIIDVVAAAQQHVDQSISMTLFYPDTATTKDVNKSYIYAWKKGLKSIYYTRIRQRGLTQVEECVSCSI